MMQPRPTTDCAAALCVLQNKALVATWNAHTDAELWDVQQDIVTGAQRLEARCVSLGAAADVLATVQEYREAAEGALARLERRLGRVPIEPSIEANETALEMLLIPPEQFRRRDD